MSFPAITQRDRLADVRQRARELRERRERARDFYRAAREAVGNYHGDQPLEQTDEFLRAQRAIGDLDEITQALELVEAEERFVLGQMAGLEGADNAITGRDSFLHDPNAVEELRQLAYAPTRVGDVGLGTLISREDWIARYGQAAAADWRVSGSGWGASMYAASELDTPPTAPSRSRFIGIVPPLRRPLTLLDVIGQQPMDTGSFDYAQEGGVPHAAETAEGAVAPAGDITLTDATCTAKSIREYLKVRREQLADMDTLAAALNTKLVWEVQLRLESQILNGDGTGENLLGILNTSGIGAPVSGAGDSVNTDLVANGIASVLDVGAVPTAVVLNPVDAIAMAKAKASTSGMRLDSDGAFAAALLSSLWGVPTVLNLGMPAKQALVGDWTMGATLFAREPVVRRIYAEYLAGRGQREIARGLIADGLTAQRGGSWYQGTIAKILANEVYAGRVRLNDKIFPGKHEAIVDPETWEKARALREALKRTPGKGRGRYPTGHYLFRKGHLRCGTCGDAMIPKTDPGRGRSSEAYQCYGRARLGVDHCPQRPVRREVIDTAVWEFFERVALDVDATRAAITERVDAKLTELEALRDQAEHDAAKADRALAKIKRDYLDGDLSAGEWRAFHYEKTAEREGARAELVRLDAQREQVAAEAAAIDVEDAVMRELTLIRAAVVGEAKDGEREGVDAFRAALVRSFARFEIVRFPGLGSATPEDGTIVYQGATPTVEQEGETLFLIPHVRAEAIDWHSPEPEFPALQRVAVEQARNDADGLPM